MGLSVGLFVGLSIHRPGRLDQETNDLSQPALYQSRLQISIGWTMEGDLARFFQPLIGDLSSMGIGLSNPQYFLLKTIDPARWIFPTLNILS
jgi:hypothetical protein